jgi:nitric oxide reductase NorE protein
VYGGLCGVLFILIKAFEWYAEASHGYTLARNDFFMFYFMLTGVHLLHVALGLGILTFGLRAFRQQGVGKVWVVEAAATFWHMVDLLWVVIFALFYVMR